MQESPEFLWIIDTNSTPYKLFDDFFRKELLKYNSVSMAGKLSDCVVKISVSSIEDGDRTFSISPRWVRSPRLEESVRRVGVLSPIRVQEVAAGRFRIVSGFQRFRAAVAAGCEVLPCLVTKSASDLELFIGVLFENLGTRELLEVEKARALLKFRDHFHLEETDLLEEFLPAMGIRADTFHLERYLRIARLPQPVQELLPELQTKIALGISSWPEPDRTLFTSLVSKYHLGRNKQHQLYVLLEELRALRMQKGCGGLVSAIWLESGAAEAEGDAKMSPSDRFQLVLDRLRALRVPTLAGHEERSQELRAQLKLPPQVQFNLPRFFEGDQISFQFSVRDSHELRDLSAKLLEVSESQALKGLFELL